MACLHADAFNDKLKQACPALANVRSASIAVYGQALLRVLYNLTDSGGQGSYEAHRPVQLPGHSFSVPCHQFLGPYKPGKVMSSIGLMHLVRCKLWQYEAALKQGGGELAIEHCGVRDGEWFAQLQSEPVRPLVPLLLAQHVASAI
jgi:hypothetical protein